MNSLTRRDFLKLVTGSLLTIGFSDLFFSKVAQAVQEKNKGRLPVIWLQGNGCGGCSNSLLVSSQPNYQEFLEEIISLEYHPQFTSLDNINPIDYIYQQAVKNKGKFYLIVEGAIPRDNKMGFSIIGEGNGKSVTLEELINNLSRQAAGVIALGTCASYGGISSAKPNPTNSKGLNRIEGVPTINLPGCPSHPDWIIGSLAYISLYNSLPDLDNYGRPKMFYGRVIHDNCPKRQYFDNSDFAKNIGDEGCLLELGCKGPRVFADCFLRQWNNGANWCIRSGAPCIGCTDPNFPDDIAPFFERMGDIHLAGITSTADTLGKIAGTVTALGIGAHLAGNVMKGRVGSRKVSKKEGEIHG